MKKCDIKNKIENDVKQALEKFNIKDISFDSRLINPNSAFFAIKGNNFDGNDYIDKAIANGASLIFTDNQKIFSAKENSNKIIYVEDARLALALAAGIIFPNKPKNIIAVTGTNGKSSVVSYVHQILSLLGHNSANIGTLGVESNNSELNYKLNSEFFSNNIYGGNTTLDPVLFRKILAQMSDYKIDYVTFEASSHGLDQSRLGDIKAQTAAFVSFSQDHLEYHKTMENYLSAKLRLFQEHLIEQQDDLSQAVISADVLPLIKEALLENNISFCKVGQGESAGKHNDIIIEEVEGNLSGQSITFKHQGKSHRIETNIIGSFQANNLLIAAKLVHNLGISFEEIVPQLSNVRAVKGRLQRISEEGHNYHIFIDYAHTPDALEKSLNELYNLKEEGGLLYVIFGCGGDRDSSKRPIMGQVASDIADIVIVTDDNPRTENPMLIRQSIISGAGFGNVEEIGDRKVAICDVIRRLKRNDILLIAGKGHEEYQIIGDKKIEFSDTKIAKEAIQALD